MRMATFILGDVLTRGRMKVTVNPHSAAMLTQREGHRQKQFKMA